MNHEKSSWHMFSRVPLSPWVDPQLYVIVSPGPYGGVPVMGAVTPTVIGGGPPQSMK